MVEGVVSSGGTRTGWQMVVVVMKVCAEKESSENCIYFILLSCTQSLFVAHLPLSIWHGSCTLLLYHLYLSLSRVLDIPLGWPLHMRPKHFGDLWQHLACQATSHVLELILAISASPTSKLTGDQWIPLAQNDLVILYVNPCKSSVSVPTPSESWSAGGAKCTSAQLAHHRQSYRPHADLLCPMQLICGDYPIWCLIQSSRIVLVTPLWTTARPPPNHRAKRSGMLQAMGEKIWKEVQKQEMSRNREQLNGFNRYPWSSFSFLGPHACVTWPKSIASMLQSRVNLLCLDSAKIAFAGVWMCGPLPKSIGQHANCIIQSWHRWMKRWNHSSNQLEASLAYGSGESRTGHIHDLLPALCLIGKAERSPLAMLWLFFGIDLVVGWYYLS